MIVVLFITKINTQHVPFRQNTEEKVRGKGLESVWGAENEDRGIKDRDERSSGIVFTKINETEV